MKLFAVLLLKANARLDTFLPAAIEKQTFLRRKGEVAFFPLAVLQDAQILKKFADIRGFRAGDGYIVRGSGIGGDFAFSPKRVAPGLGAHFEKNAILQAELAESRGC